MCANLARFIGTIAVAMTSLIWAEPVPGQIPCSYEVAAIIQAPPCPFIGPPATVGTAISPNGQYVCGFYYQCEQLFEAFVYDVAKAHLTTLPRPAGIITAMAEDVSDEGLVVGEYGGPAGDFGFIFDAKSGEYIHLLSPLHPDGICSINAINSNGVVCGTRTIDGPPTYPTTAFVYDIEMRQITDLGLINDSSTTAAAISDSGVVGGTMRIDGYPEPMLWENRSILPLGTLANSETYPFSMNNLNQVVGQSAIPIDEWPFFTNHAFLSTASQILDLGTLPGDNRSVANDINDSQVVVGLSRYLTQMEQQDHAVVWHDGIMRNLEDLVDSPYLLSSANAIANDGRIVASAQFSVNGTYFGVVLAPAPSPHGDANCDAVVNVLDLLEVIANWGPCTGCMTDFTDDDLVTLPDLMVVIENWGFN